MNTSHAKPASLPTTYAASSRDGLLEGLIVDGSRGQYAVETETATYRCTIRGRLRKQLDYTKSKGGGQRVQRVHVNVHDPVAVGDRVRIRPVGGTTGVIEEVVARAGGAFSRRDPDAGRGTLTSVAGLDQLIAVFAAREPAPHLRLLDRMIAVAEPQGLEVLVCLNKCDQGVAPWLAARLEVYRALGYRVLRTSATSGEGVAELREALAGRTSAFVGPSGAGKSSLLNAVQPGLALAVSSVSASTGKGRHTTTSARLCRLDGPHGGYIADTAGIRALALPPGSAGELARSFREFHPYQAQCHLSDCTHVHEPGCAVRTAVQTGTIDGERYASYRGLVASETSRDDTMGDIHHT